LSSTQSFNSLIEQHTNLSGFFALQPDATL